MIKFLPRWKSDTFLMYLRNLATVSRQHVESVDTVAAMNNFLRATTS